VHVVVGSAAELTYPDESFDSVGAFTMLRHIPTLALQNKVLAEAFRTAFSRVAIAPQGPTVTDISDSRYLSVPFGSYRALSGTRSWDFG
jgi:ubiquinone/menaquinone biosynthesis C-methylase UbiE